MPQNLPTPLEIGQLARIGNLGKLHDYLDALYKRALAGSEEALHQYELIHRMFTQIQRRENEPPQPL